MSKLIRVRMLKNSYRRVRGRSYNLPEEEALDLIMSGSAERENAFPNYETKPAGPSETKPLEPSAKKKRKNGKTQTG